MLSQNSPQVQTIGFNSIDGHYLILDGGQQVTISQGEYFRFLAGETIEIEPDFDAMAEYQSALAMGFSFS